MKKIIPLLLAVFLSAITLTASADGDYYYNFDYDLSINGYNQSLNNYQTYGTLYIDNIPHDLIYYIPAVIVDTKIYISNYSFGTKIELDENYTNYNALKISNYLFPTNQHDPTASTTTGWDVQGLYLSLDYNIKRYDIGKITTYSTNPYHDISSGGAYIDLSFSDWYGNGDTIDFTSDMQDNVIFIKTDMQPWQYLLCEETRPVVSTDIYQPATANFTNISYENFQRPAELPSITQKSTSKVTQLRWREITSNALEISDIDELNFRIATRSDNGHTFGLVIQQIQATGYLSVSSNADENAKLYYTVDTYPFGYYTVDSMRYLDSHTLNYYKTRISDFTPLKKDFYYIISIYDASSKKEITSFFIKALNDLSTTGSTTVGYYQGDDIPDDDDYNNDDSSDGNFGQHDGYGYGINDALDDFNIGQFIGNAFGSLTNSQEFIQSSWNLIPSDIMNMIVLFIGMLITLAVLKLVIKLCTG